jgi:MYXO-CTERM domain-containing protein
MSGGGSGDMSGGDMSGGGGGADMSHGAGDMSHGGGGGSGCSCDVGGGRSNSSPALFATSLLIALLGWRRRRRGASEPSFKRVA